MADRPGSSNATVVAIVAFVVIIIVLLIVFNPMGEKPGLIERDKIEKVQPVEPGTNSPTRIDQASPINRAQERNSRDNRQ